MAGQSNNLPLPHKTDGEPVDADDKTSADYYPGDERNVLVGAPKPVADDDPRNAE